MKNREANDSASKAMPALTLSPRNTTTIEEPNVYLQELVMTNKKLSLNSPETEKIDQIHNEFDFCENLIEEERPRKSSIEIVREEKEDLTNTEINQSIPSNFVAFRSEVNEIIEEKLISNYNENSARESANKAFTYDNEDAIDLIDDPTLFEDFEEAIAGDENTILDNENFTNFTQGIIYLDNGINDV